MLKRFGSCQKGAAAVEFALLLPVLVLITFGIIEFGLLMYNQQILTNASREGARAGVVVRTPSNRLPLSGETCTDANPQPSIECVVLHYCTNNLVTSAATKPPPSTTCPDPIYPPPTITIAQGYSLTAIPGANLGVVVKYDYTFFVPKLFGLGTTKSLSAVTVMRYE